MSGDVNAIMRKYLATQHALTTIVGTNIFVPRLPEGTALPALGFFTRGGDSNAHIPPVVEPSFQFDCWESSPLLARTLYQTLYDVLQGAQNQDVTVGGVVYRILSVVEEVQGQDVQDVDYPNYYRVIGFFKAMIRIGG